MRRAHLAAALAVVLATAVGCDTTDGAGEAPVVRATALPFGLASVDGTRALGRPDVYEDTAGTYQGVPVRGRRVQAVYEVTDGQDPVEAFRRWVAQLAVLPLDTLTADDGPLGQWLSATGGSANAPGEPGARARLDLWATAGGAVITVDVFVQPGVAPDRPAVPDVPDAPRPTPDANGPAPTPGDVLFVEKSDRVLVPDGARALIGTLPRPGGEGGSYSLMAADDAQETVDAILRQSTGLTGMTPDVRQRTVTVEDGVTVRRLYVSFGSAWQFDLTAVQGADDDEATVYLSTASL